MQICVMQVCVTQRYTMAIVSRNPYHYGSPAKGEYFAGRDAELAAIVSRLSNGINVVLMSPRRYGKTSLLLRAEDVLRDGGAAIVHVNVFGCHDLATLASRLATAAYRLPGGRWHRAAHAVPDFLRRIRGTPSVTFEGESPKFSFEPRLEGADANTVIADIYAILADVSARRAAALVLDEFQAINDLGAHVPSLLKSLADEHTHVALVIAGSKQHLMEDLVAAPTSALYGMAERITLGPVPVEVMVPYLRERAQTGKKPMSDAVAHRLVDLAWPVPNDIQRLAYEAYDAAARVIDDEAVMTGLERAVQHEAATYAERYERLSAGQRRVVSAIAVDPPAEPYSAAFVARTGVANASSVSRAVEAMREDEVLDERDGVLVVADPFFAAWLREHA